MRFLIAILVTIGLIVLIIVLLLRGTGTNPAKQALDLGSYAFNGASEAQLIIDGPIVAESKHQGLKIGVAENEVTLTIYDGYEQNVIKTQTYVSNSDAYAAFLHALQHASFTDGNSNKDVSDERGYCPGGFRYILSFNDGAKNLIRYWSTSCGNGTFRGQLSTILFLFKAQVPDYNDQVNGVTTVF